jgi:hypothetical protein
MKDSSEPLTVAAPPASDCLGRTCLKWRADGELTAIDLSLVLARLAEVDEELTVTGPQQDTYSPLPLFLDQLKSRLRPCMTRHHDGSTLNAEAQDVPEHGGEPAHSWYVNWP